MKYASAWRRVVLAAIFTGVANSAGAAIATDSVWGFINAVLAQPVDQGFPDHWLDAPLEKTMDTPREMRYAGAGPLLEDGTRLAQLELIKYANGIPAPLIVGASISGRCIALREIQGRFDNTQLISLPTHGYPGASMKYRSQAENGVLEFFVDMRSHCLSTLKIFMGAPAGAGGR